MKKFILLLLIGIALNAHAQLVVAPTTGIYFDPVRYFKTVDGGYIGLKKEPKMVGGRTWNKFHYHLAVAKYDKNMNFASQSVLSNEGNDFSGFFAGFVQSSGKNFVVCIDVAKGSAIGNLRMIEIDPVSLKPLNNNILFTESEINLELSFFSGLSSRKIFMRSSPASKRHCIFIGTGNGQFYLACLDGSLKPVWKGRYEIPGIKHENIKDIQVDDEGNVLITAIKKDDALLSVYDASGKNSMKPIALPAGKINDASLLIRRSTNEVVIVGTYGEGSNFSNAVFNAILNKKTLELENIHTAVFPETTIERLKKDGFAKTKSKTYGIDPGVIVGQAFEQGDGSVNFVLECQQILGELDGLGAGSLLIINMNGANIVFSHIPRYEVTGLLEGERYYGKSCGNELYLFYYDHEDNLTKDVSEDQKIYKGKNGVLTVAKIKDGKVSRSAVPGGKGTWEDVNSFLITNCK